MKWASLRTWASAPSTKAEASRSNAAPSVRRTSQPRPTVTADTLGASFVSETLVPLLNDTAMTAPSGLKRGWPSRLQSNTAIGRYRLAYDTAIVAGERAAAALEALADSAEFPFGDVAIDFDEYHLGYGRSVFRKV